MLIRFCAVLVLLVYGSVCLVGDLVGEEPRRLLCLHGSQTEIAVLLGYGPRLAGADTTAHWPPPVRKLPSVGYARNLSAEGVISLRPDMVIYDNQAGPDTVLQQLRAAGVPLVALRRPETLLEVPRRIRDLGALLGREEQAEILAEAVAADLQAAKGVVTSASKGLFIFHPRANTINAAGHGVVGDEILRHVGLSNVMAKHEGWKSLDAEGALVAAPEVIVVAGSFAQDDEAMAQFHQRPGISHTPAVRNGQVIVLDTMAILGYGPRVGVEVLRLAQYLQPEAELPESQSAALIEAWEDVWPNP